LLKIIKSYIIRKRRDHIKESFSILRDQIPALSGGKASRASILNTAREYIQQMRENSSTVEFEAFHHYNNSFNFFISCKF
jgi:hypothetical protein